MHLGINLVVSSSLLVAWMSPILLFTTILKDPSMSYHACVILAASICSQFQNQEVTRDLRTSQATYDIPILNLKKFLYPMFFWHMSKMGSIDIMWKLERCKPFVLIQ